MIIYGGCEPKEICGLSSAFIALIERNQRGCALHNLMQFSEILDTPLEELIYGFNEKISIENKEVHIKNQLIYNIDRLLHESTLRRKISMNGIIQTENGRLNYYALLDYVDEVTGERKRPWINTGVPIKGNNKWQANEKLKEIIREYEEKASQNVDLSNNVLFADYIKEWLENYKSGFTENPDSISFFI